MGQQAAVRFGCLGAALLIAASASAQSAGECRAIPDPAARLACYDRRDAAPAAPSTVPVPPAAAPTPFAPPPAAAPPQASPPRVAKAEPAKGSTFDSRIARVTRRRHDLFRIELEDGSAWNMGVSEPPPQVGQEVHFRRTFIGTRFFDIAGRRPIAVKPAS